MLQFVWDPVKCPPESVIGSCCCSSRSVGYCDAGICVTTPSKNDVLMNTQITCPAFGYDSFTSSQYASCKFRRAISCRVPQGVLVILKRLGVLFLRFLLVFKPLRVLRWEALFFSRIWVFLSTSWGNCERIDLMFLPFLDLPNASLLLYFWDPCNTRYYLLFVHTIWCPVCRIGISSLKSKCYA